MEEISRFKRPKSLTVANGANDSDPFDARGLSFGSVQLPGDITGTAINFKVSNDDSGYKIPVDKSGTALANITVTAGDMVEVPPLVWLFDWWRVTFITAQAAERIVKAVGNG